MKQIVVIGGGPAGLFAAIGAAEHGAKVTLLEKNPMCGRKLLITGKGRCNVTSACEREEFFEYIPKNPKFFYSSYAALSNFDLMEQLENWGVRLKTERGARVFPESDSAREVRDALVKRCQRLHVQFRYRGQVEQILTQEGGVAGVTLTDGSSLPCDGVVLATGGLSYPLTGSTGDGYGMAEALGHTVVPPRASLVPMECADAFCKELQGLALKNIEFHVRGENGKSVFLERGELLFTHFGISGPLVLSASAYLAEGKNYTMGIDLKPALSEEQLETRLLRTFGEFSNRDFANALHTLLPKAMIPVMAKLCGIEGGKKVNSITKEERQRLLKILKFVPLTFTGLRPVEEAIVTAGGIQTKEVSPKTMESKLVKGLYFAGELLDLDALTGGFNLQIAFSTGYLAGKSAGK